MILAFLISSIGGVFLLFIGNFVGDLRALHMGCHDFVRPGLLTIFALSSPCVVVHVIVTVLMRAAR